MAKRKRKKKLEPALVRRDGALCVVYANSASSKRRSFSTYAELLSWSHRAGALTGADVERLERDAAEQRSAAAAVLRRALELRSRFQRIFERLLRRQGPTDTDLEALRVELAAARAAQRLVRSGIGCRWVWGDRGGDDLDRMLWPVVTSMAEVLSTNYCLKVGQCAGEGCDLFFIDRAPGSPRKWCDSKTCGNRARSRKDYERRVKPRRKRVKRPAAEMAAESARKMREAREREAEERSRSRHRKPPGPRVA